MFRCALVAPRQGGAARQALFGSNCMYCLMSEPSSHNLKTSQPHLEIMWPLALQISDQAKQDVGLEGTLVGFVQNNGAIAESSVMTVVGG